MNIFATDPDPKKCAEALDDKRLIKMILESAQLLSTAARLNGLDDPKLYKSTHVKHPCTLWTLNTHEYAWLTKHFVFLAKEYRNRFNKDHKSYGLAENIFRAQFYSKLLEPKPFVNCTPYKDLEVHLAYKKTLVDKWNNDKRPPKWTNSQMPSWVIFNTKTSLYELYE
jgi:hypothetical protein